jgi:hypothetical protein
VRLRFAILIGPLCGLIAPSVTSIAGFFALVLRRVDNLRTRLLETNLPEAERFAGLREADAAFRGLEIRFVSLIIATWVTPVSSNSIQSALKPSARLAVERLVNA